MTVPLATEWLQTFELNPHLAIMQVTALDSSSRVELITDLANTPRVGGSVAHDLVVALITIPDLGSFLLNELPFFLYPAASGFSTAAAAILSHSQAVPQVQHRVMAAAGDAADDLAYMLGWLYPTAFQLILNVGYGQVSAMVRYLENDLKDDSLDVRRVAIVLGRDWTGTLGDLVATARGIAA